MPKKELTPALWVEKPYVTYGELEMVENMVLVQLERLLDRSFSRANE
jgi:hypothetical protein